MLQLDLGGRKCISLHALGSGFMKTELTPVMHSILAPPGDQVIGSGCESKHSECFCELCAASLDLLSLSVRFSVSSYWEKKK